MKVPSTNIPKGLLEKVNSVNEHMEFQQSKRDYKKKAVEMLNLENIRDEELVP